jgi:hypothetical protein
MNLIERPKLHWPLALMAATPRPMAIPMRPTPPDWRRLVADMID